MSYPPGPPQPEQPEQPWQPPQPPPPPATWPQPPAPPPPPPSAPPPAWGQQPPAPPPPWGQPPPPTAPLPSAPFPPSAPPAPPTVQMPPGSWAPPPGPPPAKKSNVGLIVGIIVGVVLLACVGGGIAFFAFVRNAVNDVGDALSSATNLPSVPTDAPTDAPTEPDPGPTGETFDMVVGDGVRVQDDGAEWHVFVVGAEWFSEPCEDFGVADHPILVLDIEFEVVTGTASLNTLFDLSYIDDDGESATPAILTFCDEPTLTDTFDRPAGDVRTGKIAFEVPGGKGGTLEYVTNFEPTASWVIPGQS